MLFMIQVCSIRDVSVLSVIVDSTSYNFQKERHQHVSVEYERTTNNYVRHSSRNVINVDVTENFVAMGKEKTNGFVVQTLNERRK